MEHQVCPELCLLRFLKANLPEQLRGFGTAWRKLPSGRLGLQGGRLGAISTQGAC